MWNPVIELVKASVRCEVRQPELGQRVDYGLTPPRIERRPVPSNGKLIRAKYKMALWYMGIILLLGSVNSENSTLSETDTCAAPGVGPWSLALEDWAVSAPSGRHGRIMVLSPSKGYYVTERIDTPYLSPPPPPPSPHFTPSLFYSANDQISNQVHNTTKVDQKLSRLGLAPSQEQKPSKEQDEKLSLNLQEVNSVSQGRISQYPGTGPYGGPPPHAPQGYKEWEAHAPPGLGKIVNRPPSPYKDKYKPNYPAQSPARPGIDRVDEPPRKQVSETDLHLLSAIEKLVYRADLMEKRLRKVEEGLHRLVVGLETKPDPCPANYTRVGAACYWISAEARDWKGAATQCRQRGAALLELLDAAQARALAAALAADAGLRDHDFWTGGLNPGLLWIWSHSARPVEANATTTTATTDIPGPGRCLALAAARAHGYSGRDCAQPLRYVCEKDEDKTVLSNEIERASRMLAARRKAKLLWDDIV